MRKMCRPEQDRRHAATPVRRLQVSRLVHKPGRARSTNDNRSGTAALHLPAPSRNRRYSQGSKFSFIFAATSHLARGSPGAILTAARAMSIAFAWAGGVSSPSMLPICHRTANHANTIAANITPIRAIRPCLLREFRIVTGTDTTSYLRLKNLAMFATTYSCCSDLSSGKIGNANVSREARSDSGKSPGL